MSKAILMAPAAAVRHHRHPIEKAYQNRMMPWCNAVAHPRWLEPKWSQPTCIYEELRMSGMVYESIMVYHYVDIEIALRCQENILIFWSKSWQIPSSASTYTRSVVTAPWHLPGGFLLLEPPTPERETSETSPSGVPMVPDFTGDLWFFDDLRYFFDISWYISHRLFQTSFHSKFWKVFSSVELWSWPSRWASP